TESTRGPLGDARSAAARFRGRDCRRSPIPAIACRVPGSSSKSGRPGMPERSYRILLWSLAVLGLLVDQGSKYGVFAWLREVESNTFAVFESGTDQRGRPAGFFLEVAFEQEADAHGRPVPHVNHGALFGLLS